MDQPTPLHSGRLGIVGCQPELVVGHCADISHPVHHLATRTTQMVGGTNRYRAVLPTCRPHVGVHQISCVPSTSLPRVGRGAYVPYRVWGRLWIRLVTCRQCLCASHVPHTSLPQELQNERLPLPVSPIHFYMGSSGWLFPPLPGQALSRRRNLWCPIGSVIGTTGSPNHPTYWHTNT